jgi:hypothetical protein
MFRRGDVHLVRVDSGDVHDDGEGRRVLRAEAVKLGTKAPPQAAETRDVPEVCEQLVDLVSEVSLARHLDTNRSLDRISSWPDLATTSLVITNAVPEETGALG